MTTIKAKLRMAVFGGAIGLLPSVAFADSPSDTKGAGTTEGVPDHATAEARSTGDTADSRAEASGVPDHAAAEARGKTDETVPSEEATSTLPDHATAESRGATGE
jgi:hypothetical protein